MGRNRLHPGISIRRALAALAAAAVLTGCIDFDPADITTAFAASLSPDDLDARLRG
jgi:hypothetical protein